MNDSIIDSRSVLLLSSALALCGVVGCVDVDDPLAHDELSSTLDGETHEIVDNLEAAGMPEAEIEIRDDGTVVVGGDAVVTLEASREMAGTRAVPSDDPTFRQYASTNQLSDTVDLICLVEANAYNGVLGAALDSAIVRYNELDLSFSFQRGSGAQCDATITMRTWGGTGAQAGFPSGGLPFDTVYMGTGIPNFGEDVTRHVIMHELGHAVGIRHTDYYDRSITCSPPYDGVEDVNPHGADHVPGTPTTAILGGSVMNACYNRGSDGEWTASDLNTLDTLYGSGTTETNSCFGNCGQNAGSCWCDSLCDFYGDCCDDLADACEPTPVDPPTVPTGDDGHFLEGSFCDLYDDETITLLSTHGRYVSSQDLASGGSFNQAAAVDANAQFLVQCRSATRITLQTNDGKFLKALGDTAPSGIGPNNNTNTSVTIWIPELQASGHWAFRNFNGLHMRARPSGAAYVVDLYDGAVGNWKHFEVAIP